MNQEIIDVTEIIESGQYTPHYCFNKIDKLIKNKPLILDKNFETRLQKELNNWEIEFPDKKDYKPNFIKELFQKTSYEYTYFILDKPIDIYKTKLGNDYQDVFIRIDNKLNIISGYNDVGWINNSCE